MFAQAKAHPTNQLLWSRSPFQRPFNKWCIAYFLAALSPAELLPQLTTMLKGLFRGWVSSVINEKANKDLRDAQIRDKPQELDLSSFPPLLLQPVNQRRVQQNRINRSDARKAHCRSHACKRRAVLLTTCSFATPRGPKRNEERDYRQSLGPSRACAFFMIFIYM